MTEAGPRLHLPRRSYRQPADRGKPAPGGPDRCLPEGADLSGADLSGSLLNGAHLAGSSFRGARLTGARFPNAHIQGADFAGALEIPEHLAERLVK